MRGSLIYADRDVEVAYEGANLEAEVVLGQRIRWLRLGGDRDEDHAVALSFNFGIFSRFFLEESERDLVNVGYRLSLPVEWRSGAWHGRAGLQHWSAHYGDDYIARFLIVVEQASRDGIEVVIGRDLGRGGRVYAGSDFNFHVNPEMPRLVARGGLEWDPAPAEAESGSWPFVAADFQYSSFSRQLAGTITAGVGFILGGRRLRFEGRGHFGPTFMAQFRGTDEWFVGAGIRIGI